MSTGSVKAARTISAEKIEYVDLPRPQLTPGHAVVRVEYSTLCGTDLHIWEDDYASELPLIQGHELTATVLEVDDPSGRITAGMTAAIDPLVNCGNCPPCTSGRHNICVNMSVLGCYQDGGLTGMLSVPVEKLWPVPQGLSLDVATLAEPTSIAMQAVSRGTPVSGETALVLGSGPIGLLSTMNLTELGVRVIAADTDPARLDFARQFGAAETLLIDPKADFPTTTVMELTNGLGPTLVIEATGVPSSIQNGLAVAAQGGRFVQVGISAGEVSIPIRTIPFKELDIRGSRNSVHLIPQALEMLARHSAVAATLLTHRFEFADLDTAFHAMRDRSQKVGKIIVTIGEKAVNA